ncbi:hypothetical protein NKH61_34025, partial [Mesorhizobium sp. M1005]
YLQSLLSNRMQKLLRSRRVWTHMKVRRSSKAGVNGFIAQESAFVVTEFYFNRPYHFVVAPLGSDPDNTAAHLCFDLKHDLDWVASLGDCDMVAWVNASPKPVRKVKTNAAPSLAPIGAVPSSFPGNLSACMDGPS